MNNMIKRIKLCVLFIIIVILIMQPWSITRKLSKEGVEEIEKLLEIKDAPSFKFIHRMRRDPAGESIRCLEIKFEISKADYEKNELNYGESFYEMVLDCKYIEKEKKDTYICVIRCTDRKELYEKLESIR